MSLLLKHQTALSTEKYWETKVSDLLSSIHADTTGSFWHKSVMHDIVLKKAQSLDSLSYDEKVKMPFYGLSVGMKDLFCIEGTPTTAGSKILEGFISPYTSTVWSRLESQGALLGGKLAMDEFGMGSFSNTSYLGRVHIPKFPDRSAGGSSGGCGAALKAGLVDFTVGSDTGGSVRLPASFCSVVGYKPSYGAFSRYGMIPYASSLDQAGFLTKTLEDMQYVLDKSIVIKDSLDMTCKGINLEYEKKEKYKVGYFPEFLTSDHIQEEVKKAYGKCIDKLTSSGVELVAVEIPLMKDAVQIYYILACSEASSNLARYQGIYFGQKLVDEKFSGTFWEQSAQYRAKYFGVEVQKRIMLGSYILSAENFSSMYQKATQLRKALKEEFTKVFQDVDSLVLPISPMVAPKWDEIENMTSAQIYLSDFMTVPFSLAGLPALSLPSIEGLGIGMQWVGKPMSDYQLIKDVIEIEKMIGL
jgi:aspartyl-tRNA(Asn)/glutamyl-tRNA(Gln) amidotransferase subunit A